MPPRYVAPVNTIWVPFQVENRWDVKMRKCDDLPRFASMEDVKDFIQFNAVELGTRLLQWVEYGELWAFEEYAKAVGRLPSWKYGPPLPPDEEPVKLVLP
jgi:hypothetical protein